MPLLFVVSGMAARYALGTRSVMAFARERLARLLVPFITGLVLLVPPMSYLSRLTHPAFDEPSGRFGASFLGVPAIATGPLSRGSWTSGNSEFDRAHLWFPYVLLVISLATLTLLAALCSPRGARRITGAANFAVRHPLVAVGPRRCR
jgi:glucan biosynthesis protein C